jgi:hypothetical protein
MKTIKLTPISQRAKNHVNEHGDTFEILLDKFDYIIVRSLQETWKYREGVMGKWVGTFGKGEVSYEEVDDGSNGVNA